MYQYAYSLFVLFPIVKYLSGSPRNIPTTEDSALLVGRGPNFILHQNVYSSACGGKGHCGSSEIKLIKGHCKPKGSRYNHKYYRYLDS